MKTTLEHFGRFPLKDHISRALFANQGGTASRALVPYTGMRAFLMYIQTFFGLWNPLWANNFWGKEVQR
ncbi:MAG TPA: hypothetical protein DDW86_06840 [Clostridiales bacterium]|nr:hypothetical protein [Clostridiales bacterium]